MFLSLSLSLSLPPSTHHYLSSSRFISVHRLSLPFCSILSPPPQPSTLLPLINLQTLCPNFSHLAPCHPQVFRDRLIQSTVAFPAPTSRLQKTRRKIKTARRNQNTSQRIERTRGESAKTHPSKCRSDTVDQRVGLRRRSVETSSKRSF